MDDVSRVSGLNIGSANYSAYSRVLEVTNKHEVTKKGCPIRAPEGVMELFYS